MADKISDPAFDSDSGPSGTLELGLAAMGQLRWVTVDIGAVLEEARHRLDLSPLSAVAMGQTMAAAAMLLRFVGKVPGRLAVDLLGQGAMGRVMAEARNDGSLRALASKPRFPTPEEGSLDPGPHLGEGLLRVTQELRGQRYSSQVALQPSAVGQSIAHYLEQSQQIHSAVLLGVLPVSTGIAAAGGLIVEAMPGVEEELLVTLEARIEALDGVSQVLQEGGPKELVQRLFRGLEIQSLEQHALAFRCGCDRDSLAEKLAGLSAEDREEVLDEQDRCAAECAYCGEIYVFTRQDLEGLAAEQN